MSVERDSKTNFVAFLGHDLRGHLNSVVGYSRLVLRRADLEPKQRQNLQKALASSDALLRLIDRMVDLAKLESAILDLHPAPVDVTVLLDRISAASGAQAAAKGLRFERRWTDLPRLVEADELRLQQALTALLDNAIGYSERGEVLLAVDYQAPLWRFAVADQGPGIEAERLQELLGTFAAIGGAAGTGLGIALSKALAELMGGRLQALSTLGRGSRFWLELELPVLNDASRSATASPAPAPAPATLPAEALAKLHALALSGDIMGLLEHAEALGEKSDYAAFADELKTLARGFQVNKICQLLNAQDSRSLSR